MSLGRASVHDFDTKIEQAAKAGFEGVEIFYEDLEYLSKWDQGMSEEQNFSGSEEQAILAAAQEARRICDRYSLLVIALQPFLFYEGLLDRSQHELKIQKLKTWFRIVRILGTDLIQIPSNFQSSGISGDMDLIVEDMKELAALGLLETPPVRFAYENIAWATYVDTWDVLWEIVKRVDSSNFGCCLDTFNIAGRVWADPTSTTGKLPNADEDLARTLTNLVKTIDVRKVFYVQLSDGERLAAPLVEGHPFHTDGQPARMNWGRNARLFLYEQDRGGYLPVLDVAKAFMQRLGYSGWISMEMFSRTMFDPSPDTPRSHAERGFQSWQKLVKDLALQNGTG